MNNKIRLITTISLLVISIAFIVIGVGNKEPLDVLQKAVTVCLECIGIG